MTNVTQRVFLLPIRPPIPLSGAISFPKSRHNYLHTFSRAHAPVAFKTMRGHSYGSPSAMQRKLKMTANLRIALKRAARFYQRRVSPQFSPARFCR